jgi:hypothetical protein
MQIDFTSPAWLNLQEFLKGELARLRVANEAEGLPPESRGALLGEIRLCKRLLALPDAASRDLAVRHADPGDW